MIWDEQAQAYKDSVGLVWNESARAWEERWGGVTAYVYGAALETIAIKRNGVTVGQVSTDANGKSTEQIRLACGTYDLTGSVSGWTETQTVDRHTERFRAMPEGALYWYGNECTDVTGGWTSVGYKYENNNLISPTKNTTNMYFENRKYGRDVLAGTDNTVSITKYNVLSFVRKAETSNKDHPWAAINPTKSPTTNGCAIKILGNNAKVIETVSGDIQDISGDNYICCAVTSSDACGYVYAVWLE